MGPSDSAASAACLARRLHALQPGLDADDDALLETYWRFHPRFRCFKTAPAGAALLDVGAGSGGMAAWKTWLEPQRADIRLFGVDQAPAPAAHRYDGWACLDLDAGAPAFPGISFDAAILSHVIEHVRDPAAVLGWIAQRMRPGGRIYIEWPAEVSARLPGRQALLAFGIDLVIANFFDDATHRAVIPPDQVRDALREAGFQPTGSGTIDLGIVGEEMLARGLRQGETFSRLAGFWSVTGWCSWMEATRL